MRLLWSVAVDGAVTLGPAELFRLSARSGTMCSLWPGLASPDGGGDIDTFMWGDMSTVIFVHGTGVREPAFSRLFERVRGELHSRRPDFAIEPCYWGEAEGVRLWHDGASVPAYDATRGLAPGPEDEEIALWDLLYQDPFWELWMLAMADPAGSELPPGRLPPGDELDMRVQALTLSKELTVALAAAGLAGTFESARVAIATSEPYRQALGAAGDSLGALRLAVARAIVAEALAEQAERDGTNTPVVPDAAARDHVVRLLVDALGGGERGVPGKIAGPVLGLALRLATARVRRRRGALTDATSPGAGDILLYQARGDRIRTFIADQVAAAAAPVVLLTHSLGGIAALDLLATKSLPAVRLLVTVGSQAPFLYEIGALWSLGHDDPLPAHVPAWLNVYDQRDLLSYVGARLFPGRVEDVEVKNGQPFPQSHSAYWANPKVWDAIVSRLP